MKFLNLNYGTNPCVIHAQASAHKTEKWKRTVEQILGDTGVINLPQDVSLVTFICGDIETVLDRQLTQANVHYLNLATEVEHWVNKEKIRLLYEHLEKINTPYVLSLDSLDVLINEDIEGIVTEFLKLECDILYGATKNFFPPRDFADIYDNSDRGKWRYMNAGTMIGKTESLKKFYKMLYEDLETDYGLFDFSEQGRIKKKWKDFDGVLKFDNGCKIFQTLNGVEYLLHNNILKLQG